MLGNLGRAIAKIGSAAEAISLCNEYLSLTQEVEDRSYEGDALSWFGYAYHAAGNYTKALTLYRQAITLLENVGKRVPLCLALTDLAETHLTLDDCDDAIQAAQRAVEIANEHSYRLRSAAALWVLARAQESIGDNAGSVASAQQLLTNYADAKHPAASEIRSWLDERLGGRTGQTSP